MKVLLADTILSMDRSREIIRGGAILFDEKIVDITSDRDTIDLWRQNARTIDAGRGSIALPGLVNPHVHLEFSANTADLSYGSFIGWLDSVIAKREALVARCGGEKINEVLDRSLRGGATSIGAISSYGYDLETLAGRKENIVYFNEIIGSNPAAADAIWENFAARVEKSQELNGDRFRAGVAVHSPYSTHLVLARKAVEFAKSRGMPISTHFMESAGERKWLDGGSGEFKPFFEKYFNISAPFCDSRSFLEAFGGAGALFAHCVYASDEELDFIAANGGSVVHCPVSNRLLGGGLFSLEKAKNRAVPYTIATDGLSSNYTLNMFDELRSALLMHKGLDLRLLARDLLRNSTDGAARALGLNAGRLAPGYAADFITFKLGEISEDCVAALNVILHAPREMDSVFINGERADV